MLEGSVGVVLARGDKCWLGFRAMRMMWLRVGNIANAMCWGINPLSLEHEGRISIFYCARSFSIIRGTAYTNTMQRRKKIRLGTGEVYRYPDARVTASAVWRCCIFLARGVLGIGAHCVARDPIVGNC